MPISHRIPADATIDQPSQSKPNKTNIIAPKLNAQIPAKRNLI